MKSLFFIAFTGFVLASCNDSAEKTTPPAKPAALQQTADTSKTMAFALRTDSIKKAPVRSIARKKTQRSVKKATVIKKTSDTKKG